ncbi:MAG: cytochrome b/b6 domain-containing protein [Verrucomicrobia bacterium]|nr:cytochrome b/b6 domain-containing protein [Verrucomicrobiota bacterium]
MQTALARPLPTAADEAPPAAAAGHALWVRITHWMVSVSFLALVVSGWVILMCHPRLYWGEVGNDLTPALLELPISRNHRHGRWAAPVPFFERTGSPVSASRTGEIFNQNSWGRSLHFLAAWFLVLPGAAYLVAGVATGHFRRHLAPRAEEWTLRQFAQELKDHCRGAVRKAGGGPRYGLLQKSTYCGVVFLVLPLAVVTGLAMSPAITAAFPFLSGMFGGHQSARTLHFVASVLLVLFLIVHVVMVVASGFRRQLRAMTLGDSP